MSADNWTICPKCTKAHHAKVDKLKKNVDEKYGKLDQGAWQALVEQHNYEKNLKLDCTLREDYHFDMSDGGSFEAQYSAHCKACDFSFEFKHEESAKV